MASKTVTLNVELDAEASRIAETVSAMLEAEGKAASADAVVSNAVRIAYGTRLDELVEMASPTKAGAKVGSYSMR